MRILGGSRGHMRAYTSGARYSDLNMKETSKFAKNVNTTYLVNQF